MARPTTTPPPPPSTSKRKNLTRDTTGYAGGVFGFANQETCVKDALVGVASIVGGSGTSGTIKGAAGYVFGEGYYEATITFGEDPYEPLLKPSSIEIGHDGSFAWTHADGAQAIGSINIYGECFVLGLTNGDTAYKNVVATFQDGAFQFPDAYDYSSCIYHWVRTEKENTGTYSGVWTSSEVEVLTRHKFVGVYSGDGIAVYHFDGQDVVFLNDK